MLSNANDNNSAATSNSHGSQGGVAVAASLLLAPPVAAGTIATPVRAVAPVLVATTKPTTTPQNKKKRKSTSSNVKRHQQQSFLQSLQLAVSSNNSTVVDQYGAIQSFLQGLTDDELMVWNVAAEKERQSRTRVRAAHAAANKKPRVRKSKTGDESETTASTMQQPQETNSASHPAPAATVAPAAVIPQQQPAAAVAPLSPANAKMQRYEVTWCHRFQELLDYRVEHGHVDVPDDAIPRLSKWVQGQRQLYKNNSKNNKNALTAERIQKLQNIGFRFSIKDDFDTRYAQLLDFKQQFGHTRVPQHYTQHNKLGTYVKGIRASYKQWQNPTHVTKTNHCKLTEERIQKLNEIGFEWVVKKRG